MRILILNWRDTASPRSGGAERVTHEVAAGLVARGHEVTWLSSTVDGAPRRETPQGIQIIRRGSEATTRLFAPLLERRVRPDVVLEEINTLPYLAPIWSRAPTLLYMNQLARDVWWYEAPKILAAPGFVIEPLYLKAYRGCDAITISRSSRDDLRAIGIKGEITITPLAVDVSVVVRPAEKTLTGTMVAIGRLTPSKRYDDAIRALAHLRTTHPAARLLLIGDGRDRDRLGRLATSLNLADAVEFLGRVSEAEKLAALDRADVLVGTSVREGWGLTVTEAAARAIPAVVYDIPGYRDAVVPGRTGLIVAPRPEALAAGVAQLVADRGLYDRLRYNAWRGCEALGHVATVDAFEGALARAVSSRRG